MTSFDSLTEKTIVRSRYAARIKEKIFEERLITSSASPILAMLFSENPERGLLHLSIKTYWQESVAPLLWSACERRFSQLDSQSDLRLIKRNIDRECSRRDINPEVWAEFIREMTAVDLPNNWCECVDAILSKRRKYYFMPGLHIRRQIPSRLYTYMRLGRFAFQFLKELAIADATLPDLIGKGDISGKNLEGRLMGRPDNVVWITDDSQSTITDGDRVRNILGLRHIDNFGDRMIEVSYPREFVEANGLHAPSVLDAAWQGAASNWIFAKRSVEATELEPDWGWTVDMTEGKSGARGCREAVHAPFVINNSDIQLRVLDPLREPIPDMNLTEMATVERW